MPKEKNQHKSAAASDEKFRDFFTTTVADIPAEMVLSGIAGTPAAVPRNPLQCAGTSCLVWFSVC